jgi:hypothetical protein
MCIDRFHPVDEPGADLNLGRLVPIRRYPGVGYGRFDAFACLKCLIFLEDLIEVCMNGRLGKL